MTFGVSPIALGASASASASASSTLPIKFSVISGPGTVNGNKLTVTGAGSIVIILADITPAMIGAYFVTKDPTS